MTTGQRLAALSSLPAGSSAMAHLLAIQGGGSGRTVFCSQVTAVMDFEELVNPYHPPKQAVSGASSSPRVDHDALRMTVHVFRPASDARVAFSGAHTATAIQHKATRTVTHRSERSLVVNKHPNI